MWFQYISLNNDARRCTEEKNDEKNQMKLRTEAYSNEKWYSVFSVITFIHLVHERRGQIIWCILFVDWKMYEASDIGENNIIIIINIIIITFLSFM